MPGKTPGLGVLVGVAVRVLVIVAVGVFVDVAVGVLVIVAVGVFVIVAVGVFVGAAVSVLVGVFVSVLVAVFVGTVVSVAATAVCVICAAQTGTFMVLDSNVTAPSADTPRAKTLPITVAPVLSEMSWAAIMVPTNAVVVPRVAELPTCQNTLQSGEPPLLIGTTDAPEMVVSVLPVLKTQTALGSP